MNNPHLSDPSNQAKALQPTGFQLDSVGRTDIIMPPPKKEEKNIELNEVLLNIDQVSRLTGVKKCTIRYWEKSFSQFLKPVRTESRRREYTTNDIERVSIIKKLVEEEHLTNVGVMLRLAQIFEKTQGS